MSTRLQDLFPLLLCPALIAVGLACAAPDWSSEIGQQELVERIDAGTAPLLLDVRTPGEYAAGHVPGAVNIPYDEIEDRLGEIESRVPRDGEIVLYCKSGTRAGWAGSTLEENGFTRLRHLTGDMSGWNEAGLPVE